MALARWQATIQDFQGNIVPGASVEVRQEETVGSPLAALFADRAGTIPLSNPVIADTEGFVAFHVAGGAYQITASSNNFQRQWRFTPIGTAAEFDFDQLQALLVPAGIPYTWDSNTTTTTDPGSGQIKGNSVSLGAITEIAISDLNQFQPPQDVGPFIAIWDDPIGGRIVLVRSGAPDNFAFYRISGATIDAAGFKRVTVEHIASGGVLSANDLLSVLFVPAGAPGADGVDPGHPYTFDTNQAIANPGEGNVRFNNANPAQITQIAISDTPVGGDPGVLSNALLGIALVDNPRKALLTFRDRNALGIFIHFYVLDAFPTQGLVVFDVEHVAGTVLFGNDANLSFHWALHGNKGVDGSGAVNSVFGRVGAVVAETGDYGASQVDNDTTVPGPTVAAALNALKEQIDAGGAGGATFSAVEERFNSHSVAEDDNNKLIRMKGPADKVVSCPSDAVASVETGTVVAYVREEGEVSFAPSGNATINGATDAQRVVTPQQFVAVSKIGPSEWNVTGQIESVPVIPPFAPSDLLTGAAGLWWDVQPGNCFQETTGAAATTPASVGDPVGTIVDLGGNGNFGVAPSNAARPILRQEGDDFYLEFDGTDDQISAPVAYSADNTFCIGYRQDIDDRILMTTQADPVVGTHFFSLGQDGNGSAAFDTGQLGSGITARHNGIAFATAPPTRDEIHTEFFNQKGVLTVEGVEGTSSTTVGAGNRNAKRFAGRLYQMVMIDRALTSQERSDLELFVSAKLQTQVDLFLIAGQSNAEGRGDSTQSPALAVPGSAFTINPTTFALTELADPVGGAQTGSAWPSFANEWFALTGRVAVFIEQATTGTRLVGAPAEWGVGGTSRAAAAQAFTDVNAHFAFNQDFNVAGRFVLFSQGEGDAQIAVAGAAYQSALEGLIDEWNTTLGVDRFAMFRTGALSTDTGATDPDWQAIRDAQDAAQAARPDTSLVVFRDAVNFPNTSQMVDTIHYNQSGLNEMGTFGAAKLNTLQNDQVG